MDSSHFDRVVRSLSAATPRRATLGFILGGALGLAGFAGSEAKKGKSKKKNKTKEFCKKATKACGRGKCKIGQSCCSDLHCDDCTNSFCVGGGGGRPGVCGCEGTDIMMNGRCGTLPVCLSAGERREFGDIRCCSGSEITDINDPANGTCLPGVLSCLADSDCTGGKCRGFVCAGLEVDCPQ